MKRKEDYVRSIQNSLSIEEAARLNEEDVRRISQEQARKMAIQKSQEKEQVKKAKRSRDLQFLYSGCERLDVKTRIEALSEMVRGGSVSLVQVGYSSEDVLVFSFSLRELSGRVLEKTGKQIYMGTRSEPGDFHMNTYDIYEDEEKPSEKRILKDEVRIVASVSDKFSYGINLDLFYDFHELKKKPAFGSPIYQKKTWQLSNGFLYKDKDFSGDDRRVDDIFLGFYKDVQKNLKK